MATYTGNGFANIITGTNTDDVVKNVGVGLDIINTLDGNDIVYVNPGAGILDLVPDLINMGNGIDTLVLDYSTLSADFTLSNPILEATGLSGVLNLASGSSLLVYSGVELFNVSTGSGADNLHGGIYADSFASGAGIDTISGGDGDDTIEGGLGGDFLDGGTGNNTLDYRFSIEGVTVDLKNHLAGGGEATGDSFTNFQNIFGSAANDRLIGDDGVNRLSGSTGQDVLTGAAGDDVLNGGNSNDTLIGGSGFDVMAGGLGADKFVYLDLGDSSNAIGSRDKINDFSSVQGDKIDLSALDANAGIPGDQGFRFIGTQAFSGVAGEVHTLMQGVTQIVQFDSDGDKHADLSIVVLDASALVASDFIL